MYQIDFEEPETFETPDGREWIVNPLLREKRNLITKFMRINNQMNEYRSEGKNVEANGLLFGDPDSKMESLPDLANKIIDLSIKEVGSGEKFPEKYRGEILKLIELSGFVVNASMGNNTSDGDDTPLQKKKKTDTTEQPTTSSSKKQDGV